MNNIYLQHEQTESSYDMEKDIEQGFAILGIKKPSQKTVSVLKAAQNMKHYCQEYKCDSVYYSSLFDSIGYSETVQFLEKRYDCMMNLQAFQYVLQEYAEIHIPDYMAQLAIDEDGGEIGIRLIKEFNKAFHLKEKSNYDLEEWNNG